MVQLPLQAWYGAMGEAGGPAVHQSVGDAADGGQVLQQRGGAQQPAVQDTPELLPLLTVPEVCGKAVSNSKSQTADPCTLFVTGVIIISYRGCIVFYIVCTVV